MHAACASEALRNVPMILSRRYSTYFGVPFVSPLAIVQSPHVIAQWPFRSHVAPSDMAKRHRALTGFGNILLRGSVEPQTYLSFPFAMPLLIDA